MPSWFCHLVAAGRSGENFGGIRQAAFLLGNLSPDWSVFACGVNRELRILRPAYRGST